MKRFRPLILLALVILTGFISYGLWSLPKVESIDSESFSAARVAEDIEVISRDYHSVAHPEERAEVRQYLTDRLIQIGADTVMHYQFDSLIGPQNKHVIYTFDAVNVLAEFAPENKTQDDTYLMLIAHYDSRFSQIMPKDTVWSYGAADDGYGLGVILEAVSQAMKNRNEWKQGIKVLFTDAEEVGMLGMKSMIEHNPEVFENVGFVINLEARGPWGPCLLFETSPGNEKVMELYAANAEYPVAYSLTTVVYTFMPNFTDFKQIKDSIPGMNFSSIADINHYHTDLDNFSNISEKTIQHYGSQLMPVVMAYLTGEEYADRDYMKAENDSVYFSLPFIGLLKFSSIGYNILNYAVFFIFSLLLGLEGIRGRLKSKRVFKNSCIILMTAIFTLAFGELIAYICASVAGADFKPFGLVHGVGFDNVAMIISAVALFLIALFVYMVSRKRSMQLVSGSMRASASVNAATQHAYSIMYGALTLTLVLSLAMLIALNENMFMFIPLACATTGIILWHLTSLRVWLLAAIIMILLHSLSFLYTLAMALTIGALGAVLMIALIDLMVMIPLADLYLMPDKKR